MSLPAAMNGRVAFGNRLLGKRKWGSAVPACAHSGAIATHSRRESALSPRSASGSAAPMEGEDVLLSEARIVSESREPWEPAPRLFPSGSFDPRTAIFRAREAYRDRARAKATAGRQLAAAEAAGEEKFSLEDSQPDSAVSPSTVSALEATTSLPIPLRSRSLTTGPDSASSWLSPAPLQTRSETGLSRHGQVRRATARTYDSPATRRISSRGAMARVEFLRREARI